MSLPLACGIRSMARAGAAETRSATASAKAGRAEQDVRLLTREVDKLSMITEALWTLLKEQHGYTDEDLILRVTEIDLEDGVLDGKVRRDQGPRKCPACSRTLSRRHPTCLYCGKPVAQEPFA